MEVLLCNHIRRSWCNKIDALGLALLFETGKDSPVAEEMLARLRRVFAGRAQASLKQASIQDFFLRAPRTYEAPKCMVYSESLLFG